MERKLLWAPWRMEFLTGEKPKNCVFCTLPAQNQDRENLILTRKDFAYIILNKYPYNNGHIMIVPYQHTADLLSLSHQEEQEIHQLIKMGIKALQLAYRPDGFNIGMNLGIAAGAGIKDHLHYHIVPRWGGDSNFMPVIGEIKAMPQHLLTSYDILLNKIKELQST